MLNRIWPANVFSFFTSGWVFRQGFFAASLFRSQRWRELQEFHSFVVSKIFCSRSLSELDVASAVQPSQTVWPLRLMDVSASKHHTHPLPLFEYIPNGVGLTIQRQLPTESILSIFIILFSTSFILLRAHRDSSATFRPSLASTSGYPDRSKGSYGRYKKSQNLFV